MTDKIYCGIGRIKTTKYGDALKLAFSASDLDKLKANLDNGWVSAWVNQKQDPQPDKPTHYLVVDTWKPDTNQAQPNPQLDKDEPLPF